MKGIPNSHSCSVLMPCLTSTLNILVWLLISLVARDTSYQSLPFGSSENWCLTCLNGFHHLTQFMIHYSSCDAPCTITTTCYADVSKLADFLLTPVLNDTRTIQLNIHTSWSSLLLVGDWLCSQSNYYWGCIGWWPLWDDACMEPSNLMWNWSCLWPGNRAVLTSMLYEWAHVCLAWQKGYFIRFKWYAVWMSACAPSLAERLFYCFNLYAAWMSATAPDLAERSFYVWLLCDCMVLVERKLQFWSQGPSDVLWKETALSSLTDTCIVITHSIERQGEEVLGHLGQHIGHSWLYCSNSHHNNMIDYVGLAFYHVTLWAIVWLCQRYVLT